MADTSSPLSHDAHYIVATADLYGWKVTRESDGPMELTRPGWIVTAVFNPDGRFRHGHVNAPGTDAAPMDLRQVLDVLEQHGSTVLPT
ncbi:hypothetical protein [Kitasatospora sp. NPDC057015]|uniref:hypothetical protein n=1 Tax=Kitasatospora sp. NPDC057015 TaxID=3346001 RepID=UPI00363E36E5